MGLAWQQGPLAPGAVGCFLVAEPLPQRLLYAEPLRRRMRVMLGGGGDRPQRRRRPAPRAGRYPRWYVPRGDVVAGVERQTFCPYNGLCSYYDVGGISRAGWSYHEPYRDVDRIGDHISFEPDKVTVTIDSRPLHAESGQNVASHGPDRGLTPDEVSTARATPSDLTLTTVAMRLRWRA